MEAPARRTRAAALARPAGALLLALVLLAALRVPLLRAVGAALRVEDEPARADLILLLNGGVETRPAHAARLYHAGLAPRVVIAQARSDTLEAVLLLSSSTALSVRVLQRLGVPGSAIRVLEVPGGAASTQDEARAFAHYLRDRPADRVLVVTSDYHTRRTRWTLRRELDGREVELRMAGAPSGFSAQDWWSSEEGLVLTVEEYLKLAHTWMRN